MSDLRPGADDDLRGSITAADPARDTSVTADSMSAVINEVTARPRGLRARWLVPALAAACLVLVVALIPWLNRAVPGTPAASPAASPGITLVVRLDVHPALVDCRAPSAGYLRQDVSRAALGVIGATSAGDITVLIRQAVAGLAGVTQLRVATGHAAPGGWSVGREVLVAVVAPDLVNVCHSGPVNRSLLEAYDAAFGPIRYPGRAALPAGDLTASVSGGSSKCRALTVDLLREELPAQAVDATITSVKRDSETDLVNLEVTRWYRGGPYATLHVVVPRGVSLGTVTWRTGERVLLSLDGFVQPCLSSAWTPEAAAVFDRAFA